MTLDSLENLHRSLASCPGEHEKEPTPLCLTVPLLPHQERALKWLLWRETQTPAGKKNNFVSLAELHVQFTVMHFFLL